MFGARASRLALRRGVPLMGGLVVANSAYSAYCDAPKPVAPPGSTFTASWSADSLPKKKTSDPAVVKPPLALQDEFDVVVRRRVGGGDACDASARWQRDGAPPADPARGGTTAGAASGRPRPG